MGVYHFAGLGKSIGAVTAAFSYLAARKQRDPGDPFFALSGERGDPDHTRGSVEALVLFSTAEIIHGNMTGRYLVNEPGHLRGAERTGIVRRELEKVLKEELRPLARRERGTGDGSSERTGPYKPVHIYWCEYERNFPVETFERVVKVMRAAKLPGKIGKEIWVNLTGGSNIINGALQMAASMLGTPARLYYLLTEEEKCIRHTVSEPRLATASDHFWVDLPMVYLDLNPAQWDILNTLAEFNEWLPLDALLSFWQSETVQRSGYDRETFVQALLRPLIAQRLVEHEHREGQEQYRIGMAWQRQKRYLQAFAPEPDAPRSLPDLVRQAQWFTVSELQIA